MEHQAQLFNRKERRERREEGQEERLRASASGHFLELLVGIWSFPAARVIDATRVMHWLHWFFCRARRGRAGASPREADAADAEPVVATAESRKQKAKSRNRTGDNETGGEGAAAARLDGGRTDASAQGRPGGGEERLALAPRNRHDLEMDRETA